MVDIEDPHEHDVLCGRGVTINKWPGNESFRRLVGLNKVCLVVISDLRHALILVGYRVEMPCHGRRGIECSPCLKFVSTIPL
jgi:hypothetical protein